MRPQLRFIALFAVYLHNGCGKHDPEPEIVVVHANNQAANPAPAQLQTQVQSQALDWGYVAKPGIVPPPLWGTLSDPPGSLLCSIGTEQSPIVLNSLAAPSKILADLAIKWRPVPIAINNTGHTIEYETEDGGTLTYVDAKTGRVETAELASFHLHYPSEHTLDGVRYPIEIHFVHVDTNKNPKAVIGVFAREGAPAAALNSSFQVWPARNTEGRPVRVPGTINPAKLLPANKSSLTYPGSLTTPPCTEGLSWFVMRNPIEWSAEQIAAFRDLPKMNPSNRPEQPLNDRRVKQASAGELCEEE